MLADKPRDLKGQQARPTRMSGLRLLLPALALIGFLLPITGAALSPTAPLASFPSETQARQHCPGDMVVWLNLLTGIYHSKGQRWYGLTKSGAYVCRTEANQAGMRGSLNGQ
jgi:hypothetical protein